MTPAASVSLFRPAFDDFLYAQVGVDRNEMTLSVLSALARLDIDPWKEAAELSELAKNTAAQRLALLVARLPGGRWTRAESAAIADRLIELLPHPSPSKVPVAQRAGGPPEMIHSAAVKICTELVATGLIISISREPSSRVDHTDVPAFSSAPPSRSQ